MLQYPSKEYKVANRNLLEEGLMMGIRIRVSSFDARDFLNLIIIMIRKPTDRPITAIKKKMAVATSKGCFVYTSEMRIRHVRTAELFGIFTAILCISCAIRDSLFGDRFLYCDAWTHSLLFKSKETFKLAEIQNLEASLQTTCLESFPNDLQNDDFALRFNLTRLVVDRATGSSLFRLDLQTKDKNGHSFTNVNSNSDFGVSPQSETLLRSHMLSLSSLRRCDWIGQVIVEGCDPHELIETLQQQDCFVSPNRERFDIDGWSLDYVKLIGEVAPKKKPSYSMKSLLCAVAHEMPSRPFLTPALAKSRLLIVDTASECADSSCYLIQCLDNVPKIESKSLLQQKWARRPFQYSSAINFEIAEMVLEILMTLCSSSGRLDDDSDHSKSVLLDPTCGSGTFLALALDKGLYVEGCDINPSAAEGALRNIEYLFDKEKVDQYANVENRDSCDPWRHDRISPSSETSNVSCVVANLPWVRSNAFYESKLSKE